MFFIYNEDTKGDIPLDVTHLKVDPSVKEIHAEAFEACHSLVEVEFSEGLKRINNLLLLLLIRKENRLQLLPIIAASASCSYGRVCCIYHHFLHRWVLCHTLCPAFSTLVHAHGRHQLAWTLVLL